MIKDLKDIKIAIVGLGYVGLPLAVAFGKTNLQPVIGYNRSKKRLDILKSGHDPNGEISDDELAKSKIEYTDDELLLKKANFIIITVPTPITEAKQPDLEPVRDASRLVGKNLQKGSVVVYESTVYPGVTEDICIPIIEKESGLKCGVDWKIAYSPERVNPGDQEHTVETIVKVVSGMDEETLNLVADVYGTICKNGVHRAPNIKTAEAAKVIENIQRDLNIALMNELSLIFHRMGLNTKDVIEAAGTKWNFHKYQPGLVGGHCIGVDPYYLTYRAQELGYSPEVILAGRRINDWMPEYVADLAIRGLIEAGKVVQGSKILVFGLTFKEDIRDIRNSKIKDTIKKLKDYGVVVLGHDPNLKKEEVEKFGVEYVGDLKNMNKVDGIILNILHKQFMQMPMSQFLEYCNENGGGVLIDIKSRFLKEFSSNELIQKRVIYKCL